MMLQVSLQTFDDDFVCIVEVLLFIVQYSQLLKLVILLLEHCCQVFILLSIVLHPFDFLVEICLKFLDGCLELEVVGDQSFYPGCLFQVLCL